MCVVGTLGRLTCKPDQAQALVDVYGVFKFSLSLSLSLGVCQKSESTAALCVAFSGNSSPIFSVLAFCTCSQTVPLLQLAALPFVLQVAALARGRGVLEASVDAPTSLRWQRASPRVWVHHRNYLSCEHAMQPGVRVAENTRKKAMRMEGKKAMGGGQRVFETLRGKWARASRLCTASCTRSALTFRSRRLPLRSNSGIKSVAGRAQHDDLVQAETRH